MIVFFLSTSDTRLLNSNCSRVHFSFNSSILKSEMSCCESSVLSQSVTFSMLQYCTLSAQWNLIWSSEYQLLAPYRLILIHHVLPFTLFSKLNCSDELKWVIVVGQAGGLLTLSHSFVTEGCTLNIVSIFLVSMSRMNVRLWTLNVFHKFPFHATLFSLQWYFTREGQDPMFRNVTP